MSDITALIHTVAKSYALDPLLVEAICITESSKNPYATRYEPGWSYFTKIDHYAKRCVPAITSETERVQQAMSWGLMQIMGSVARELGFIDNLSMLVVPEVNLKLGCRHFIRLKREGYTVNDQIAAYNAGSARKAANGLYVNQQYVDKVVGKWKSLQM